jgi:cytochrome c
VKAIAVEPTTGRILTGGFDYAMMYWSAEREGSPVVARRFDGHGGAVNAVAFAVNDTVHRGSARGNGGARFDGGAYGVAAGDDFALTVWQLSLSNGEPERLKGHSGKVVGLAVSPDGNRIASASWDRTARVWSAGTSDPAVVLRAHTGPVNAVAFSADGARVYTASADGHVRSFDSRSGTLDRPIHKHSWGINVLARIPGTDRLVFGALNGDVAIVDATTGAVTPLKSHERPVLALAVIEKPGLIATGGGDGVIRVMRATDGAVIEEYKHVFGPVWALAFAPDGKGLYYGGLDDFVTLWRFSPREPFEAVDATTYPRRFQVAGKPDDPIAKGELQFARKCSICHTLTPDGANRAGPTLHNLFGRRIGSVAGYPYSPEVKTLDIVWNAETIDKLFALGPDRFTPGSKMPLQVMQEKEERDQLIAFLRVATNDKPVDGAAPSRQESPRSGESKP